MFGKSKSEEIADAGIPFRLQLEHICEEMEKTKIERQRRHSDFIRRFNEIVSRHDRIKSGRLRRLSVDGIIVDLVSLRREGISPFYDSERSLLLSPSPGNRTPIHSKGPSVNSYEVNNSLQLPQLPKVSEMGVKKISNLGDKIEETVESTDAQKHPKVTFKLELSFHCNSPPTATVTRPKAISPCENVIRKPPIEPEVTQTTKKDNHKLHRAYSKIVRMKSMTVMRRQNTVLSLQPKDMSEDLNLPTNPTYRREWSGHGFGVPQNLTLQKPKVPTIPQLRASMDRKKQETDLQIGAAKPKLHRTVQRVQTWRKFKADKL